MTAAAALARTAPAVLLLACSSPPSRPTPAPPAAAAPRDPLAAAVDRGRLDLHDEETAARLGKRFDPRELDGAEGFIVELERTGDGWSGVVGRVPLGGCCLEPVETGPLERAGTVWRVRARQGWSFWECDGQPMELTLRRRPDGRYDARCGGETAVLTAGASLDSHVKRWEGEKADALLAAASDRRLAGGGGAWTFEGRPVGTCAILTRGCDSRRLVASCQLDGQRLLRVEAGAVTTTAGDSPLAGAEQCADGALPGLREAPPPG